VRASGLACGREGERESERGREINALRRSGALQKSTEKKTKIIIRRVESAAEKSMG
jgi:hypothetical protein